MTAVGSISAKRQSQESEARKIELELLAIYNNKCGVCGKATAVCAHEIQPKSLRPADWHVKSNRIPVCHACHVTIHNEGTAKWAKRLRQCKIDKEGGAELQ